MGAGGADHAARGHPGRTPRCGHPVVGPRGREDAQIAVAAGTPGPARGRSRARCGRLHGIAGARPRVVGARRGLAWQPDGRPGGRRGGAQHGTAHRARHAPHRAPRARPRQLDARRTHRRAPPPRPDRLRRTHADTRRALHRLLGRPDARPHAGRPGRHDPYPHRAHAAQPRIRRSQPRASPR